MHKRSAIRDFPPGCGGEPSSSTMTQKRAQTNTRHRLSVVPAINNSFKENKFLDETAQDFTDHGNARTRVCETLRLFRTVFRSLEEEQEAKEGPLVVASRARAILRKNGRFINTGKQIFGAVPGVEVGDEFLFWMEFNIVGLHRRTMTGIDYVNHNGKILASSVVSSGEDYGDELDNVDVLVYTGQGGNLKKGSRNKEPKDQAMKCGNLALKNSCEEKNPVRVIIKSGSKNGRCDVYVYYGLYEVEVFWKEIGPHGKLVFKFQLRRLPGQPEVGWVGLRNSQSQSQPQTLTVKHRNGICVRDISHGKETIPICVINKVDDAKPPFFNYLSQMVYPDWFKFNPFPIMGCDCTNGCSDSEKCYCAMRNGGKIPFNQNRAIIAPKALVYECGPHCKCPVSCKNRVSQHGIQFQLEIFRTNAKRWGVRSPTTIPYGSFVCEYTGEVLPIGDTETENGWLLDDEELEEGEILSDAKVERRTHHNNEYVFHFENNQDPVKPVSRRDCGFAIDAANSGNVARFINHSCSPNLFAQNVLYDHGDRRVPHIMLFAGENIPHLQMLTYHCNVNVKKKNCNCGPLGCIEG